MKIKDYYGEGQCPECHCEIPDDAKVGEQCACGHTYVNTFKKITVGYVIQEYQTFGDTHVCLKQEFVAGEVQYESTQYGDQIDTVDTLKETYCPPDMKQPKQIPSEDEAVKFVCPGCGDDRVEAVLDGSHTTSIEAMFKSGGIEYGDTESTAYLDRFQCVGCGYHILDSEGCTIKDDEELVEWCKKNCNQE